MSHANSYSQKPGMIVDTKGFSCGHLKPTHHPCWIFVSRLEKADSSRREKESTQVAVKISVYRTSGPLCRREKNFGCGSYNCMHDIRFFYILCKPSSTILQEVDSVSAMRWHSLSMTSRPTTTGALTEFY